MIMCTAENVRRAIWSVWHFVCKFDMGEGCTICVISICVE